jgi:hypothetical protein
MLQTQAATTSLFAWLAVVRPPRELPAAVPAPAADSRVHPTDYEPEQP